jgi:hypothetical protein
LKTKQRTARSTCQNFNGLYYRALYIGNLNVIQIACKMKFT